MKSALARLPKAPAFVSDYEISRGVSTVEEGKTAKYVRLRREFKNDSPLQTIQYSLSSDAENTIETLVFRGRNVKDLLALSIEDKLSTSVSKPSTVIQTDTPASRLRVERAGKTTLGLARCEGVDQSLYEPIFAQASATLADYRRFLRLRTMLAGDIAWFNSSSTSGPSTHTDRSARTKKSEEPPTSPAGSPTARAAPPDACARWSRAESWTSAARPLSSAAPTTPSRSRSPDAGELPRPDSLPSCST